jgi:membrane-associated phospholipid phosphatase
LLVLVWIIAGNSNKYLEIRFLLITVPGGWLLEQGLRLAFHRPGPSGLFQAGILNYTFPGEQPFMAVAAYGFAAYILMRHDKNPWLKPVLTAIAIIIFIFSGLNPIFFQAEYPSDTAAGYVFGGLWLCLNIILLEIYRILPRLGPHKKAGSM